ncbi:VOC family protein [Ilumatobacter sp.]|uniref:VOC family protein n=1 Tax=Ilumatobacter sp. TaxID=1967498 RepID=UPI003B51B970
MFDAADVHVESAFWAEVLDGAVVDDDPRFHCVVDADSTWLIGVQHAPDHTPPDWPHGTPGQQIHLDLHVDDPTAACACVIELGARPLFVDHDPTEQEVGFQVFADPAGHPFCIGWGHPDDDTIRHHVSDLIETTE